jgi:small-conductance mechanosensitive channel
MTYEEVLKFISDLVSSRLFIISIWIIASYIAKVILIKIAWQKIEQIQIRLLIRRIINIIFGLIVILAISSIWLNNSNQLGTFFGLFSAGVAIALKDLLVNLMGWIFISTRRPYSIGDRIEISTHLGDVIDISFFETTVLEVGGWVEGEQSTGRILHLPNGLVFTQGLANYTKGFEYIWSELPILLTFESDWQHAKELILRRAQDICSEMIDDAKLQIKNASQKYLIQYKNIHPVIYTSVKASGVQLTLRFLCIVRQRRLIENNVWESILKIVDENKAIDFAYPTQRFFTTNQHLNDQNLKEEDKSS